MTRYIENYKRKFEPPRCTMKVYVRKAYYTLDRDFILEILEGLNFPEKFTKWVMLCVTNPSYSLSNNGNLCGFFKGKRGVRQGDHI